MSQQLRLWQEEALAVFEAAWLAQHFALIEAPPGAGKTTFALEAVRRKRPSFVIVVVPTTHLKRQWAKAAVKKLGLQLYYRWKGGGRFGEYGGVVVTYQQLATQRPLLQRLAQGAFVIVDEIHHAADGRSWGVNARRAFGDARFVLSLSGTPFRTDDASIPFLRYQGGYSQPDYSYTYGRAVTDRVCRPVAFMTYGGEVRWRMGRTERASNFEDINEQYVSQRLAAALDPFSGWIQPLLRDAHDMLLSLRREQPNAGGLLVAANQEHARKLAEELESITGESPVVVLSDEPSSSKRIEEFADGNRCWIVACNMVSEGVDIPRLRVGVYATNIKTAMYFRQFIGRIARVTPLPGKLQVAYCYLPADHDLLMLAREVEQAQKHFVEGARQEGQQEGGFAEEGVGDIIKEADVLPLLDSEVREELGDQADLLEQLMEQESEWQALGSEGVGMDNVLLRGRPVQLGLFGGAVPVAAMQRRLETAAIASLAAPVAGQPALLNDVTDDLRSEVQRLVGRLSHQTREPHSAIYGRLNRQQRVQSQKNLTHTQLEQRLNMLRRWLR